jgi:hypothetical protein
MLNSLFRTASATALLLAAGGMHVPLLASVTTAKTTETTHQTRLFNGHHVRGNDTRRRMQPLKSLGLNIKTPFSQIVLPKINAKVAAQATASQTAATTASSKAAPRSSGTGLTSSNGTALNFPGFFHPSQIATTLYDTTETEVSLTADVNKDGKPDLITILQDGTVNVLLNTGSGLPTYPNSSNTSAHDLFSADIYWASTADLNNDGYPDIEFVDPVGCSSGYIYILMNNGDGTFGAATQIPISLPSGDSVLFGGTGPDLGGDVIFADVTGDSIPDLVIISGQYPTGSSTSVTIQVLAGAGDGTFPTVTNSTTSTIAATVNGSYHSLQAADMNNDGQLDLVWPVSITDYPDGPVNFLYNFVLTGNKLGIFSPFPAVSDTAAGAYAVAQGEYAYSSYVGNVGSAASPAVVVGGDYGVYSQLSNNNGTLQAPITSSIYGDDDETIGFADVTGDGKVDVISYGDGWTSIFQGNGDGSFSTNAASIVTGESVYQQAQPADFNGDGIVDLPVVDYTSGAGLNLGLGAGAFKSAPVVAPPADDLDDVASILTGNLTGHGFADVLNYDFNSEVPSLVTAVNDGKGNFTYTTAIAGSVLADMSLAYVEPVTIDINNDGKPDLLLVSPIGLFGALNNGDGTFATPVQIPLTGGNLACPLNYAAVADINNDGKQDIAVPFGGCETGGTTSAGIFTLFNNGDGTFTSTFIAGGTDPYTVSFADFNKDSKLDAMVVDNGSIYIFPGNGDGTFNLQGVVSFEYEGIYYALPGDYDVDGNQDIIVFGDFGTPSVSPNNDDGGFGAALLKGRGDFTFAYPVPTAFGFSVAGAAYADFNGDGLPDLVLSGYSNHSTPFYVGLSYMVNLGAGTFSAPILLPSYENEDGYDFEAGTPVIVGDFNGDAALDFLGVSYYASGIFYNVGGASLTLTTSAATATQDSSVTLTATVVPSLPGSGQATGTITFYDNGVAIGTVPVSGDVATLTLSTLPVGANALTAVYSGDASYNSASSSTNVNMTSVSVTALPAAFTMTTVSGGTLDLTVGQTGVATFSVTGNATFSGPIALSCSGAPAGTSCTISPTTLTLAGAQTATFTAVLDTTAPNNHFNATNSIPTWLKTTGGITLAGGLLLMWPNRRRRNLWTLMLLGTLGMGAMVSLTGCDHKYSGTPAGTYNITVTATAGSITQTGTIALTVHK